MSYSLKLRGRLIISVVSIVIVLVIANTLITTRNNRIIEVNRKLQRETEAVKVTISQFAINIIHNLDLGVRSYALFNDEKYLPPLNFAIRDKDSLIQVVETTLRQQHYPMKEFLQLKDSINSYATFCLRLKELYDKQQRAKFFYLADLDKGYQLWLQYERFALKAYLFEDQINEEATRQYEMALFSNYLIQLILFLVSVPALLIMAGHTKKKFALVEQLRQMDIEKTEMLVLQNVKLEQMVQERTREIQSKNFELSNRNDEIATQNEELTAQREQLAEQRDLLAEQNHKLIEARKTIEIQNQFLEKQVEERTNQLVQYNQQLERFTYLAAHDLRGPVARILGLGHLLSFQQEQSEISNIVDKLIQSTKDLDQVVNDLGRITEIKQEGKMKVSEINFTEELVFLKNKLRREIFESKTTLKTDFSAVNIICGSKKYFRNILYQILHNAIKFRHPERNPVITLKSESLDCFVLLTISDNGIGLDIDSYRSQLFEFHKRFHDHVEGRGLGLYMARIQIVAMGGKIEMDSQEGSGTTVKIFFRPE
jgi:K+-sensing histidine kinase KdpD